MAMLNKERLLLKLHLLLPSKRHDLPLEIENNVSLIILRLTFIVALILQFLQYEYIDGYRVPSFIFKGMPSSFQVFIVCCMFSFSGSISSLLIHKNTEIAGFLGFCSLLFLVSAIVVLLSAVSMTIQDRFSLFPLLDHKD